MLAWLLACTGGDKDTGPEDFDGTFVLTDSRNYTFSSSLDIGCQEVALAEDFTIDWSALTTDMLGSAVDLADITSVSLVAFDVSREEVEDGLVKDQLNGEDLVAFAAYDNSAGGTSCQASQMVIPPAVELDPAEHFVDADYSWLVTVGAGITDNKMVSFLCPVEGSPSHDVVIDDTSTTLSFEAELEDLDAFDIEEPSAYHVEWSGLTKHANGEDLDLLDLDQLMLARYDMSVPDIESDFIRIEDIASEMYTISPSDNSDGIYGLTEADLTDAVDADGNAFTGFGSGTLWLLALRCTTCTNPAPPFLTVIEVL